MGLAIQDNIFGSVPVKPAARATTPEVSVKYATYKEIGKPVYRNGLGKMYLDPRPDIDDDSELWVTLLVEADKMDTKLWDAFLGFRCIGARLLPTVDGGYVLRPHIDPSGNGGFRSQEEYKEEARRWLHPHKEQIKILLSNLEKARKQMWPQ